MEGTIIGSLFGVAFLTIINVAAVAFSYGRITQKVRDLCRRVLRLEAIANGKKEG